MIDRASILATDSKATQTVSVDTPEWGGSVLVRRLTVLELERWWDVVNDAGKGIASPAGKNGTAVLMGAVKEDGTRLFEIEDATWLGEKAHPQTVSNVAHVILSLSGVIDEVKAELEKKPESTISSSSTGSPTGGESGM